LTRLSVNAKRLLDLPAEMSRGSSTGDDEALVVESNAKIEKEILRIGWAIDSRAFAISTLLLLA